MNHAAVLEKKTSYVNQQLMIARNRHARRANDIKRHAKVIAKAIELAEQNGRPDLVQRLRGA